MRAYAKDLSIPQKYQEILRHFFEGYDEALRTNGMPIEDYSGLFLDYLDLIRNQCIEPFAFDPITNRSANHSIAINFGSISSSL